MLPLWPGPEAPTRPSANNPDQPLLLPDLCHYSNERKRKQQTVFGDHRCHWIKKVPRRAVPPRRERGFPTFLTDVKFFDKAERRSLEMEFCSYSTECKWCAMARETISVCSTCLSLI